MRRGYRNGFLLDKHGNTVAINLGSDQCAEHEWGIKNIRRAFEMQDEPYGLDRRIVRKVPDDLRWYAGERNYRAKWRDPYTKKKFSGVWYEHRYEKTEPSDREIVLCGEDKENPLATGWSEGDFGAFAIDDEEKKIRRLREIYDALMRLDAAIWLGGGGVFQNAGFAIGIVSRLEKSVTDNWYTIDKDRDEIKKEVEATGIEAELRKAGKGWFALSPRREKGKLTFWLNPMDQQNNNSAWVTLDDLRAWIRGEGPIPKKNRSGKNNGDKR